MIFFKTYSGLQNVQSFLPNLLCPNFNFSACAKVEISGKKLQATRHLQEQPQRHL